MTKIDSTVLRETKYIAAFVAVLSLLMQSVFLVAGIWNYTVLLGNILGFAAATGNFLLMGITVQKAVEKEEKDAKSLMKLSQSLRLLMMFIIALLGYMLPFFNTVAVIIPFLFPRIAIAVRPLFNKEG
ncbi:MAG: ATP synthase subunit I [Clostridia bacterium]|nr:ATP synthase subunit I [Clostridia bacterium]